MMEEMELERGLEAWAASAALSDDELASIRSFVLQQPPQPLGREWWRQVFSGLEAGISVAAASVKAS
jgi:hypothetical protein